MNYVKIIYSGYTQVILRLYSLLRVCSDYSKGILRVYSRYTQGIPRVYSGSTWGILGGILVVILGVYQLAKSQRYIWVLLEYTQGILGYTRVYSGYY